MITESDPSHQPQSSTSPRRRFNWLLYLVLFVSAVFILFLISIFSVFWGMQPSTITLNSDTTLSIDLAHSYPEQRLYDLDNPFAKSAGITFRELLFRIRDAGRDEHVERLLLFIRGTELGWANTFELRKQLLQFRKSGKVVVAFIESSSNREYVIASAADQIFLHPRASIDLRGIRAEASYFKNALEKIGVEAEFERFGDYKDSPDAFLRETMSSETREALGEIVGTLHQELVEALMDGRGFTRDEAEQTVQSGPFTSSQARDFQLVDELRYLDEVFEAMNIDRESEDFVAIVNYGGLDDSSVVQPTKGHIALIYGIGAIVSGSSGEDLVFGRVMGADTIAQAFKTVRLDDNIDAVVFRVDSPGGSDVASDTIFREAWLTNQKKPVVVSMGNVAASGGYWISMGSDALLAEKTSITGSIGIYAGKFNLSGFYNNFGVNREGVSSAPNADFYSDIRNFTASERNQFRSMVEDGYRAFIDRVAEARGKTFAEVHTVARGRVWSGRMALKHGLIDGIGGLEQALELAKEKAGFEETDKVEVDIFPAEKNVIEVLLSKVLESRQLPFGIEGIVYSENLLKASPLLTEVLSGSPLAFMPYRLFLQ